MVILDISNCSVSGILNLFHGLFWQFLVKAMDSSSEKYFKILKIKYIGLQRRQ